MAEHLINQGEAVRQARNLAERLGTKLDTRPGGFALLDRHGHVEIEWRDIGTCLADLRHLRSAGCAA